MKMLQFKRLVPIAFAAAIMAMPAKADDPVVASVDGVEILLSDIERARDNLPEQYRSLPMGQVMPVLLTSLIDTQLVAADAERRNLDEETDFMARLAMLRRQLLEQYAVRKAVADATTDEALRELYQESIADGGAFEIRARHILLETADAANEVINELDGGADFAELAREKSTGPSGPRGGDLGFFGRGQMVAPFEMAAFDLDDGAYTKEPVQTQFGFHVIKVEERREVEPPSFEESVGRLREEAVQRAGEAYVGELRNKAEIKRFNVDLSGN